MAAYTYPSTDRVLYGAGVLTELRPECDRLGARRVMLLSTPSLEGSRIEGMVRDQLGERCAAVSRDCAQHVPSDAVDRLIAVGRDVSPDAIVTVGGGSVTDAAKALAAALAEGFPDAAGLRARRIVFEYPDKLQMPEWEGEPIPIVSVPTT